MDKILIPNGVRYRGALLYNAANVLQKNLASCSKTAIEFVVCLQEAFEHEDIE